MRVKLIQIMNCNQTSINNLANKDHHKKDHLKYHQLNNNNLLIIQLPQMKKIIFYQAGIFAFEARFLNNILEKIAYIVGIN